MESAIDMSVTQFLVWLTEFFFCNFRHFIELFLLVIFFFGHLHISFPCKDDKRDIEKGEGA